MISHGRRAHTRSVLMLFCCLLGLVAGVVMGRWALRHRHAHRHQISTSQDHQTLPMPRAHLDRG